MEKVLKEALVGEVTHYYDHLGVAIVKFSKNVPIKTRLHFVGKTTDFEDIAASMQLDHNAIEAASANQEVGIKVSEKVREGDRVYICA